jgi:VWFA-related protein
MFLAVPTIKSSRPYLIFFVQLIAVWTLLCSQIAFRNSAAAAQEGLRLELPNNGNLRVENLRGGVIINVWDESYVSVSAISDRGELARSPALVQRTDTLLAVRVTRGSAATSRINLQLRVPAAAHLAVVTTDGSIEIRGNPAALLAQTISGEIRLEIPSDARADVTAESETGIVSSSIANAAVKPAQRPQLEARLGNGGRRVRLYSQAGNIAVAQISNTETAQSLPATRTERSEALQPRQPAKPEQRPELAGSDSSKPAAGTPASPSTGPEDVSEGDVIRVDTQLVTVNVSVVDRGSNRGVSDLAKQDFRLSEDGVAQQILHFDAVSAPFNLVLLIDLSGSTTRVVELIKSAALHFVEASRPFDRIGIITFAAGQVVVSPLTTDHAALHQRIAGIAKPDGSTKMYDSLAFAMEEVTREAKDSRRNAIVVLSDGLDSVLPNVTGEGSTLSYEAVVRRTKEFDGVLYSIWVDTQSYEPLSPGDIQQETFDLAHDRMKQLADVGGGGFYECEELKDLAGAYDRVVADLGMVYTLGYRPSNKIRDGSWRAIRVNVSRPNTIARGKSGYFAK